MPVSQSKIIVINGTSSSGKSTLCAALQKRLDSPFWHLSSDHFIQARMHPSTRFDDGTFNWIEHRPAFFDAFHHSVAAFANAGLNLIVEHIVEEPSWSRSLSDLLKGHDVFVAATKCPLDELETREIARGDRHIGEAKFHMKTYELAPADIEIDTTKSPEACCDDVIVAWNNRSPPGAFHLRWNEISNR